MLWASPPAAGADADGRLLVDVTEFVLLVTEFLLSFVGTRAGRKLSSDIAFQPFGASCLVMMHGCGRYERFQSVSAQVRFQRGYESVALRRSAESQRVGRWCCLEAQTGQDPLQRGSKAANQSSAMKTRQFGRRLKSDERRGGVALRHGREVVRIGTP